jgi:hypothetical protein
MPCRRWLLLSLLALAGCGALVAESETKPFEEPVTPEELTAYMSVVAELPGKKLPPLPSMTLAAPAWSPHRTLPVKELAAKHFQELDAKLTVETVVKQLNGTRGLDRALRKVNWSIERFASFTVSLAAALNRTAASEDELAQILDRATPALKSLAGDNRVFASLPDDLVFTVLDRARWIPLVQRARWLSKVSPETLTLVRERMDELKATFPPPLLTDPIAPLRHVLRDEGIPFRELPDSGSDADIPWPMH